MTIRLAKQKDFLQIKKLVQLYPDRLMQHPLPKSKDFFVAEQGGKIIGACALEIYSKRIAEVRSLVVSPNFQSRGIGSILVNKCLQKARQRKIYEVLTITGSVKFFSRIGFKPFNREKYALLKVVGKKSSA